MRTWQSALPWVVVVLSATLVGQVLMHRSAGSLSVGEALEIDVQEPSGQEVDLASAMDGECAYLVIADPLCSACASARDRWARDVSLAPDVIKPVGWRIHWVIVADGANADGFASGGRRAIPVEWSFSADRSIITSLGITGFPSYLILDRGGRLVEKGVGARLPPREAFQPGCMIE